ncbi:MULTISPECIES: hypothetical protein [unclassified Paenibacillus]|nr:MULTISPECIES: hypothetical protein [unclassified Paenibacillus]MBP1157566.1 hypothetical protein [Paenibacillus sp. PvP091]MBP1171697.1 hypothetical protein [Paenibacillus sp. PvR098]MBP2438078.1 hypothetical protein [Paenibacillus sp. PvP052]
MRKFSVEDLPEGSTYIIKVKVGLAYVKLVFCECVFKLLHTSR